MQMQGEGVYLDGDLIKRHWSRHDGQKTATDILDLLRRGQSQKDIAARLEVSPSRVSEVAGKLRELFPDLAPGSESIVEQMQIEYHQLKSEVNHVRGELQTAERLLSEKRFQCQVQHEEIVKLRKQVEYFNLNAMAAIQQLSAAMVAVTDKFPEGDNNE